MNTTYLREATISYKRAATDALPGHKRIGHSLDAARVLLEILGDRPVERFVVIALDGRKRVTAWALIGQGTSTYCTVDPAELARFLVLSGASAAIVGHNHPSGDASPSQDDIDLTRRLASLGAMLNVPIVDHIVIGGDGRDVYSFLDHGTMPSGSTGAA